MIEHSPIFHKPIYESFAKLQKAVSQERFRVKSLRAKTVQNDLEDHIIKRLGLPSIYQNKDGDKKKIGSPQSQKMKAQFLNKLKAHSSKALDKNYEEELNKIGIQSQFLQKLFDMKTQQAESHVSKERYHIFIKNLALRLCYSKNLIVTQLGYSYKALCYLFDWLVSWDGHISEINLSNNYTILQDNKLKFITDLIQKDDNLLSLILCNNKLNGQQLSSIFKPIIKKANLFVLDLSNHNSHNLNRFGQDIELLSDFIESNLSVSILKLNNIQLKREGVEAIWKGITMKKKNHLRMLSISNNHISGAKVSQYICDLLRSGLTYLDLSCNPLGQQFYKSLPYLKATSSTAIRQLNLSQTGMKSDNCYDFFSKIQECKTLAILKLDDNDFSHHWFSKMGQKLQINNSLEQLSINNCEIKSLMPFFHGLIQNKYLKRLYASHNNINGDNELPKKIADCFEFNKDLEELRFKFCNLKQDVLVNIIQSLACNKKLRVLDISQNLMNQDGAHVILKMLETNNKLESLGIQKLQISQQIKKRIQIKLQQNREIRQKINFRLLKNIKKEIKQKDAYTWDDLQRYQLQELQLQQKLQAIKGKVTKLQGINDQKKKAYQVIIEELQDQEKKIQAQMQQKIRQNNELLLEKQNYIEIKDHQIAKLSQNKNEAVSNIQLLQIRIKKVNMSIKTRQNDLEEMFRNKRYIQKKKGNKGQNLPTLRKSIGPHH